MSHAYTAFTNRLLSGTADMTNDTRIFLAGAASTAGTVTDHDAVTIDAFSVPDEYVGAPYPTTYAARLQLATEVITKDDANNWTFFNADPLTISGLAADGGGDALGVVVYEHTGAADTGAFPSVFIDSGGFPFNGTGADVTFNWNAAGIFQVRVVGAPV